MPAYRYLLCDLLTDRPLADLPLTGVGFERRISRVGSFSGTLTAPDKATTELARLAYRYAGRAALYVYRDNALWWGGVLWTTQVQQGARGPLTATLQAATFDSFAHRRKLYDTKTYTQQDQGVIVPDLWRTVQSYPVSDIGVVAEDQPTGYLRDRTYKVSDLNPVGKLIEDLGDVDNGPEHTIDVYLDDAGERVKRLRVANQLGDLTPRTVFQRVRQGGGRVVEWSHVSSAIDNGTTFVTRGDAPNGNVGEEVDPLLSQWIENETLLSAGWPYLDVSEDHPGVSEVDTLNDYTTSLLYTRSGNVPTSGYVVEVGNTGWNPNKIGDAVRIKMDDDWHGNADLYVRPVACTVSVASRDTSERVTLILGEGD